MEGRNLFSSCYRRSSDVFRIEHFVVNNWLKRRVETNSAGGGTHCRAVMRLMNETWRRRRLHSVPASFWKTEAPQKRPSSRSSCPCWGQRRPPPPQYEGGNSAIWRRLEVQVENVDDRTPHDATQRGSKRRKHEFKIYFCGTNCCKIS